MVSEPIEFFGPKSMAEKEQPLIRMQKEQQERKHTRKPRRLKYSCEEVYERMDNGLCLFCDELDTPGHHDLKHKGIQIFMVDDDLASDDIEEFHQTQETVTSPEPIVETTKNLDSFIEPLVHDSVSQAQVEELPQKSTSGIGKKIAHQLFDQMTNPKETIWDSVKKDFKETKADCGKKIADRFKLAGDETSKPAVYDRPFQIRVWDSGGSPSGDDESSEVIAAETVIKLMHKPLLDNKYSFVDESSEKDVKVLEAQQGFKTQVCSGFDVKALIGLETYGWEYKKQMLILTRYYVLNVLSLDDGVFMTAKRLLISPRGNQVWEPGGVSIEQGEWKWSQKCYERSKVMRLMQGLISVWWKGIKFREFHRLSECSWVDIKTWHFVKHETQQTDFHVWHRWKNKAEKLPVDYARLELMMLGLVSFQPNKGTNVVGTEEKLSDRFSLANYVWKPGELLCVQDQWDWISEVHKMGHVLKIMQRFHGLHLQGIINMDMRFREVIVHDVLSVKVCLSVCNRKFEAELEVYLLAHHNSKNQKIACGLIYGDVNFHLKHKWRSRLLQSFSDLKQRILVSLWKSLGYLMEAHGSKYEGLVCALERKKLRTIENDIDHLKKLLATMEGLAQKISCGLLCGNVKFHLKHKWRSRLEFCVKNAILFTSSVKLLFPKNDKLLHYEAEFCAQYNDLKQHSTEFQSFPGLDYFTCLIFLWNQTFNCGCEAGFISSGSFSVGNVNEFFICSNLQNGDETHGKRLLDWNEISLLDNDVKVNLTIKANWFYKAPMIRGVFHLQRPPELINLQGKPNFITKVPVQWKEHPPDQFFSSVYGQVLMLSSLRTRMF